MIKYLIQSKVQSKPSNTKYPPGTIFVGYSGKNRHKIWEETNYMDLTNVSMKESLQELYDISSSLPVSNDILPLDISELLNHGYDTQWEALQDAFKLAHNDMLILWKDTWEIHLEVVKFKI